MSIFLMTKAAQGFSPRRTFGTSQAETRGEHSSSEKGPFPDGHGYPLDPRRKPP